MLHRTKMRSRARAGWAAILLLLLGGRSTSASNATIRNDRFWTDASGNPLYSQGGGIWKFGGKWYWYGVHYAGAETYAANPAKQNSDTRFVSVTCYSSTDLVNWTFEGNVLDSSQTGLSGTTWMGRLGVARNPNTGKYVLLSQHNGASGNGELFATSDSPAGKFAFHHIQEVLPGVANSMSGDQTVFVDDDGKAYLACSSSSGRAYLYVAPLRASDYLAVEQAVQIAKTGGREGNCMFKHRGRYYFCSSDLHGWNASHTYVISATSITGPYGTESVMGGTDMDFSHVSQTGFFVRVDGSRDTIVVFAGDRWSDFAGNGLGYNQWTPLSFDGAAPSMNSISEWNLDASTGTWSVGDGNNWILNPSFEADRVVQTALAGWTDSTDQSTFPGGNAAGGRTGRFALSHSASTAYVAKQSQVLSGLPPGNYALSGWVRSSGGQKSCVLYARTSGREYDLSAATSIPSWQQISRTGIPVSDGKVEVGVRSVANAEDWVRVDDLSLVREPGTGLAAATPLGCGVEARLVALGSAQELERGVAYEVLDLAGRSLAILEGDGLRLSLPARGIRAPLCLLRPLPKR